jgi:hypothetical protein
MTKHKLLIDDFEECDSFVLIAIHSALEDYRIAFLLNQNLNLKLKRSKEDLDLGKAKYSMFEWEDTSQLITWTLVSNICKIEEGIENNPSSLFSNEESMIKKYNLIPEHNSTNYILKIMHQTDFFREQEIIDKLLSIQQIVTAYAVETETLKSKTNLIFN